MSTSNQPVVLTEDEAKLLRDALRRERESQENHELSVLRARVSALEAASARRAVFESIADAHSFDATDAFEFDFQSRTLTIKKGNSNGAAT
jgi:hypothetical protein